MTSRRFLRFCALGGCIWPFKQAQLDTSRTCVYWNDKIELASDSIYEVWKGSIMKIGFVILDDSQIEKSCCRKGFLWQGILFEKNSENFGCFKIKP